MLALPARAQPPDGPAPPQAPEVFEPPAPGTEVSFNLEDADLPELVQAMAKMTGKRLIYSGNLRPLKATIYAPEKVTAAEVYEAFLSILTANGLTVVPSGRFLKIVESQDVVRQPTTVYGPATPVTREERFVTRLYRLAHVRAADVQPVLDRFRSKDGDVTSAGKGDLLILTDTGPNIVRMVRLLEEIDVGEAGALIWVQPVLHASAVELAEKLAEVIGGSTGGAPSDTHVGGARVVADDRTNHLVIVATRDDYARILDLLRELDVPLAKGAKLHAVALQHTSCEHLAPTLAELVGAASPTPAPAGASARAAGPTGALPLFESPVRVTCDVMSNKLLAQAAPSDFLELSRIVEEIDTPRRQVFIEAIILDVTSERTDDVALGYHFAGPIGSGDDESLIYGGHNALMSAGGPGNLEALAVGVRGPEVEDTQGILAPGLSIPALGIAMHAVATDSSANVIATPHILATDNVVAEIAIGQDIPLQTNAGATSITSLADPASALAAAQASQSSARADVGTKIQVTPHLNDSNQVRLELSQEISTEGPRQGDLNVASINKRTASTSLVVEDRQTVVIGGLVRDGTTDLETKIPILGDIPLLGALFRSSYTVRQKSNLLLILTPTIVRDKSDLRAIFERKMQERQEFLDRLFVFSEAASWTPPTDFRAKNGLLEAIRQEILTRDRAIAMEASLRETPQEHAPVDPLAPPSSPEPASAPTRSAPAGAPGAGPLPAPPPSAAPRPRPRPAVPGPAGGLLDRVE